MQIDRLILRKLDEWKNRAGRMPLIIQGARQIGKTWVMKRFGETRFKHTAYFNFDLSEELKQEFEHVKDPARLVSILQLYTDVPVIPGETLLIFDEIQECNKALNSLKYFCEQAPQYPIIAAGSLLGVSLSSGNSFPVGKVECIDMLPVSFREFLYADNPAMAQFADGLQSVDALPEIVMGKMTEAYRRYQVCGGMPAAASAMLDNKGNEEVEKKIADVLRSYELDFSKHAPAADIPRIAAIWKSIPSQLARENRKFVYKLVKNGARAREYEDALLWLQHAGLVRRVFCSTRPGLPLSAYDDLSAFKIYLSDCGLLRVMSGLPADIFWTDNPLFTEFRGALAENAVLESLVGQFKVEPRYWTSSGTAEVDFILQYNTTVIPVEVKSGTRLTGKSLGIYRQRFTPPLSVRFSMNNLTYDDGLLNIPVFLADWARQLINLTLS